MALPVFKDRILGKVNDSYKPQYNVEHFLATGEMKLKNPIDIPGTKHNADMMNNLLNYESDYSFPNCEQLVTFPQGKAITEWRRIGTDVLVASIETSYDTMTDIYKLYADDGITVIQSRTVQTLFEGTRIRTVVTA